MWDDEKDSASYWEDLFRTCKRNYVSTFHQYACFNIKRHACNARGSSQIYKRLCRKVTSNFLRCTLLRGSGWVKEMAYTVLLFSLNYLCKKVTSLKKTKCVTLNAELHFPVSLNVKIICLWLPLKPMLPGNTQLRSTLSDQQQGPPIIRWN